MLDLGLRVLDVWCLVLCLQCLVFCATSFESLLVVSFRVLSSMLIPLVMVMLFTSFLLT